MTPQQFKQLDNDFTNALQKKLANEGVNLQVMRVSNEAIIYLINGYPYTLFNDGNKAWWKAGSYV